MIPATIVHSDADSLLSDLVPAIRTEHRLREDFLNAEKALTLQIRAICRRVMDGDTDQGRALYEAIITEAHHPDAKLAANAVLPLLAARDLVSAKKKESEKRLEKFAKRLPVWKWVETQRGLGALGLGQIVGECGDLSLYATKEKLWKRMGLHVSEGHAPRPKAGEQMDFSPRRRAVMWNIGEAIKRGKGHYRDVYDARKVRENEKAAEEGREVLPSAYVEKRVKAGESRDAFRSKGHIDKRARRYAEKMLLRDLWNAWRRSFGVLTNRPAAP